MEKKRKVPVEFLVILAVVVLIGLAIFLVKAHEKNARAEINGKYSITYASTAADGGSKDITVYIEFDSKKGTFNEYWNSQPFVTGKYTVNKKNITVTTTATDSHESEKMKFIYDEDNDVIIPAEFIYEGKVPSEDTFDAEFKLKDSAGGTTTVHLKEDGTFENTISSSSGESKVSGTYERDGNVINRTKKDGSKLTGYYVYKDQLVGAFYVRNDSAGEESTELSTESK